jgi:hypothetical protein
MNRKYSAKILLGIWVASVVIAAMMTFLPGWLLLYFFIGAIWSGLLFMGLGPLRNWRENATFWSINIFLWPLVLALIVYIGVTNKYR